MIMAIDNGRLRLPHLHVKMVTFKILIDEGCDSKWHDYNDGHMMVPTCTLKYKKWAMHILSFVWMISAAQEGQLQWSIDDLKLEIMAETSHHTFVSQAQKANILID